MIPEIPAHSFAKRLYSTFLSYLPKEKAIFDLKMNVDNRGSFTELVHTLNCGQVSINISKPGITKGEHWHHTKWEQFIVVSGHGLIQLRNENDPNGEILEYEVSGDKSRASSCFLAIPTTSSTSLIRKTLLLSCIATRFSIQRDQIHFLIR